MEILVAVRARADLVLTRMAMQSHYVRGSKRNASATREVGGVHTSLNKMTNKVGVVVRMVLVAITRTKGSKSSGDSGTEEQIAWSFTCNHIA